MLSASKHTVEYGKPDRQTQYSSDTGNHYRVRPFLGRREEAGEQASDMS
jgi:hypothetical protein